jgi:hypothetical protein
VGRPVAGRRGPRHPRRRPARCTPARRPSSRCGSA